MAGRHSPNINGRCALLAGCAGLLTLAATPALAAEETATLPLRHHPGASVPNAVTAAVGGGDPVPVLFDTGSSGLRILEGALGPDLRKTGERTQAIYGDGTEVEGYVGYARVSFPEAQPPIATSEPVRIDVITTIRCKDGQERCPGLPRGTMGIMGTKLNARPDEAYSPLMQLPGQLKSGFIVDMGGDSPRVTVGLQERDLSGFRFASLQPAQPDAGDDGQKLWDTGSLNACFWVDGAEQACSPIVFDTGGSRDVHFKDDDADPALLTPIMHYRHGPVFTMKVGDVVDLSVRVGPEMGVRVKDEREANSSRLFFNYYAVAFDGQGGRIGFKAIGR
ncbi:hypothetical protein [Microvirga pudoricolor]|uniref:hypothetical protein n=1 Tax=Microvirga pudoricolor TaxID=2778729 RepID=UPI00194DE55B|nr:hypothetical protein [Microvirga pudoricolor]MBM6594902.1 hypothetical protein [Microvirga pudoricolor]